MSRSRMVGGLILLFGLGSIFLPARADDHERCVADAPPPGAHWSETDEATRLDAVLDGRLIGYALPKGEAGRREILLLVDPVEGSDEAAAKDEEDDEDDDRLPPCASDAPRRLYRIVPSERGETVLIRDDLPADSARLESVDLDGDGRDEILLYRPGRLVQLDVTPPGESTAPRRNDRVLVEDPDLGRMRTHPRVALEPALADLPLIFTAGSGAFRVHGPSEKSANWTTLAEAFVPPQADLQMGSMRLRDRKIGLVGRRSDGHLWFATRPDEVDSQRLEVILLEVSPAGAIRAETCWARLPQPEFLLEFRFLVRDDRPWLAALTAPRGELNLFGEKELRIFPLEPSRSRLGSDPLFALKTRLNVWQQAQWHVGDLTGDGRPDLLISYWKGLTDDRVALDLYAGEDEGAYATSPRTTAFNVKEGDRSFLAYGHDLTGDGLGDLVVRSDCDLVLYPGQPTRQGSKLLDRAGAIRLLEGVQPDDLVFSVSVGTGGSEVEPLGGEPWTPRFVDLDGDGRVELLAPTEGGDGAPGRFRVVWLH